MRLIIQLTILSCFLVGTNLGQRFSLVPKFMGDKLNKVPTAVNQGIDLINNVVKYGTTTANDAVLTGTDIVKTINAATTALADKSLKGGVEIGTQVLDLGNTLGELVPVPGSEKVVNMATSVGKEGIKIGESLASKGLAVKQKLTENVLTGVNKATQIATGTIENAAKAGTDMAKGTVGATLGFLGNIIGSGYEFFPGAKSPPPTTTTTTTTTPKPSFISGLWG